MPRRLLDHEPIAEPTPQDVARPLGITLISIALALAAIWLLVRGLQLHVRALSAFGRGIAVIVLLTLAIGLWRRHNGARIFLFYLFVLDILSDLAALFLYALRQSHYALAGWLVLQIAIAVFFLWYLQSANVKRAFGGYSAWPKTVKMLVLTLFTVAMGFPFYWMAVASF